ncbi:terpenoid synthase [Wilcoxina mikolae CBS 423.85]|nr:terpenoid synthase [Wilcoxina mikolae CBS 423.85]
MTNATSVASELLWFFERRAHAVSEQPELPRLAQHPTAPNQQFNPNSLRSFIDSMGYDMAAPPYPTNTELEATVIHVFETNRTIYGDDYLRPLQTLLELTCSYSEMAYHHHPLEIKVYISVYTTLLAAIDDDCERTPSAMISQLTKFVTSFHKGPNEFKNPILNHVHRLITTETPKYFGPLSTAAIIKGTLDCFIGWVIESKFPRGLSVPESSSRFPRFLRWKTGDSEAYALMMFPEALFPEELYLETYLPAIPEIIELVNGINDIMSFYKESVVGTEENTFMMNTARLHKRDPVVVLEDFCQEQVQLTKEVVATLSLREELKGIFEQFIKGYIMWHASQKRYRLGEIGINPGASG